MRRKEHGESGEGALCAARRDLTSTGPEVTFDLVAECPRARAHPIRATAHAARYNDVLRRVDDVVAGRSPAYVIRSEGLPGAQCRCGVDPPRASRW